MSKTKTTISDYWEAFIAVGGAVMSTADALIQLQSYHQFRPDIFFLIGFILFIGFGTIAYIKLFRKLRDVQKEKQSVNLTFSKPIFQNGAINLIIGEYSGTLVLPNSENEFMQEKTQSRKSPQLALNIERIPNIITANGKEVKVVGLRITSNEKTKIMELRAYLNFAQFRCFPDVDNVITDLGVLDARLFWLWTDSKKPEKEIELRPEDQKMIIISELINGKTDGGKNVFIALMGTDPVSNSVKFNAESIFKIQIKFQARLENEHEYRNLYYEDSIYAKPENLRLLFLDDAERSYSDIPNKLIGSSKTGIQYFESKNE